MLLHTLVKPAAAKVNHLCWRRKDMFKRSYPCYRFYILSIRVVSCWCRVCGGHEANDSFHEEPN